MSRTIWKFPLPVKNDSAMMEWKDRFDLDMPRASTVLSIQVQHGQVVIWALVDPDAEREKRSFILAATGRDVPRKDDEAILVVGTVQLAGGGLVLHLFENLGAMTAQKN